MEATHTWELQVGDYTFEGECEITDKGVLSITYSGGDILPKRTEDIIKQVLDLIAPLPATYSDLKKFKIKLKD